MSVRGNLVASPSFSSLILHAKSSNDKFGGRINVTFSEFMRISFSGSCELSTECESVNATDLLVYFLRLISEVFSAGFR